MFERRLQFETGYLIGLPYLWWRTWHPGGSASPVRLKQERRSQQDPKTAQAQAKVLRPSKPSQNICATLISMSLNRSSNAQSNRNRVVHNRYNQTGRNPLMLFCYTVAEQNRCGRVAHVHAEGHHQDAEEAIEPKALLDWGCCEQQASRKEGAHAREHDPMRHDLAHEICG